MNIPMPIVIWILGMLGAFLSFCAHLLIVINGRVSALATEFAVNNKGVEVSLASLNRHKERNEQELLWMRQHIAGGELK